MSYSRPSFAELKTRISADLALIPPVLAEPLAAMWARACHSQHGYLDWILAQCSPLTCELERLYDWAMLYGVDRLLPVAAQGFVMATGNPGAIILAEALLRAQNGFDYQVLAAVTLSAVPAPVLVRCTSQGANTNIEAGQVLTLIDPILGVNNSSVVGSLGLTGGADIEDVDAWRLRVADEWRTIVIYGGRSGKPADYRAWAKSAHPSVSGALVQPHALGIGTVLVRLICNSLPDRQPTEAIINTVAAFYLLRAPATAVWSLAAPLVHPVVIAIDLSPGSDTLENRQAITDALKVLIDSKITELAVISLAEVDIAILSVTSDYIRLAPLAPITAAAGEVFVLNPVTFS